MKQRAVHDQPSLLPSESHPLTAALRRRRSLILPRFLADEAAKAAYEGTAQEQAYEILGRWADLESRGQLRGKETSLDAQFLTQVFGEALGFTSSTQSPDEYHLEHKFTIPEVGTADGALGLFASGEPPRPVAVLELKDAQTNLDADKFNGRTPVQQCWDYMNALPECPWGIVSNFVTFRLYHRDKGPQTFEHFTLQELRERKRFREFYCLFERGGLLETLHRPPRALVLLQQTGERQRQVGNELYEAYNRNRLAMVEHLHRRMGKSLETAIAVAQKLLDRIIFIAFCEDRGLLVGDAIKMTFENVPPYVRVTNPRWRNFLDLFHAIDQGHPNLPYVNGGYNGGLFEKDPEVDDLQLDDEWTLFFKEVASYDFSEEINVDVLGHLFERSVTDLERLRTGGLPRPEEPEPVSGKMDKSPQRKRQGIFYTPPQLTALLVKETVGVMIEERLRGVAERHGLDPDQPGSHADHDKITAYANESIDALRTLKVCDPSCGSGAFLIQVYDVFENAYSKLAAMLDDGTGVMAPELANDLPDVILKDNIFGVDLSKEAVEITQLALWIRSVRRGRTLADLSANVVCGNSLVSEPAAHERAMDWTAAFPTVFRAGGFDCVIGNPPWERLKLQEREFFSASAPKIAEAVSAAERRKLIGKLKNKDPELFQRFLRAKESADRVLAYARDLGRFPLTGKGDVNTYMLFAELARQLVAPKGRVGLLVPSGIATDDTTKDFFAALMDGQRLIRLYDFENRRLIFPDVDGRFKFSALVFGGDEVGTDSPDFVFFAHSVEELDERSRHIRLTTADLALLNPNTRTCPVFRTRRDYGLTKAVYNRVPILVEELRGERGDPWGIRFATMFHQTNDAELFHDAQQLKEMGFKLHGNRWRKKKEVYLPLYEAKMIQIYDHRAASVAIDTDNWMRQGQPVATSLVAHLKPEYVVIPRWWVPQSEVDKVLGGRVQPAYLCYKDVTSATNRRTMIAAFIPHVAVVNSAPLIFIDNTISHRWAACLLANLNSFVLDYVARQKVGGNHLNFFIVNQLPMLPPDAYADRCPWKRSQTLEKWISDRVLKLTCTADDMVPLAEACGMDPPVHKWKPAERAELMADLDAAYFHLYGVSREDAEYILSTFSGTQHREQSELGSYRTADMILERYDRLVSES